MTMTVIPPVTTFIPGEPPMSFARMEEELRRAGWRAIGNIWKSPGGKLFGGTGSAYKIMRQWKARTK
jgi:hypothetical protein